MVSESLPRQLLAETRGWKAWGGKELRRLLLLGLAVALVIAGCWWFGQANSKQPGPDRPGGQAGFYAQARAEKTHLVAKAAKDPVLVYADASRASQVTKKFPRRNRHGVEQVFLVVGEKQEKGQWWYQVLLPVRPKHTTGWLPQDSVSLYRTEYALDVDLSNFRLTVSRRGQKYKEYPIARGHPRTPTPVGDFYIVELLEAPNKYTVYGPYAFGLSGFSEELINWKDGGQTGIHGTGDPEAIGRAVTHGCVRLYNNHIAELAKIIPLGTPVKIHY